MTQAVIKVKIEVPKTGYIANPKGIRRKSRVNRWVRDKLDERKYGESTESQTRWYHVAGPVHIFRNRLLGANQDISAWVPDDLMDKVGRVISLKNTPQDRERLEQVYISVRDAYLSGQIDVEEVTPLNEEVFLVPVKEKLATPVREIREMKDVTIGAKGNFNYSHPLEGLITDPKKDAQGRLIGHKILTGKDGAEEALKRLALWRLSCGDYSDQVGFEINRREKPEQDGAFVSYIIDRHWSRANQGMSDRWTPVDWGTERIIISGRN